MKKIIYLSFGFLFLQNTFSGSNSIDLKDLDNRILEVIRSEKIEENIKEKKENSFRQDLIQTPSRKNEREKDVKEKQEEVTLNSLQSDIKEIREILKNTLEGEEEQIYRYTQAEDYLDFKDKEEREQKISLSNYIEYINNYTRDYDLAREINKNVMVYSKSYGISPELVLSLIKVESRFNPTITSSKGAYGLMQLTEDTANHLNIDRNTIGENIKGGIKLLKELLDQYNNDLVLALASYNAGLGSVKKYNGVPPYEETKQYIEKVMQGMSSITKQEIIIDSIDFDKSQDF